MKRFLLASLIFAVLAAVANAIPVSGDYVRVRKTDTSPVEVAGYGVLRTLADGRTFIDTGASSGTLNAPNPDVIAVGPMGDSTTIAGAITLATGRTPSATNRITILVFPGVYAEETLELPDYVDLIGVSRDGCIISKASTGYVDDARQSALVSAPGNSLVANLTINNPRSSYPSTALNLGWGWTAGTTSGKSPRAVNCVLIGAKEDVLYTSGNQTIIVSGCQIYSTGGGDVWSATDTSATAVHRLENSYLGAEGAGNPATVLWMKSQGRVEINNCRIRSDASSTSRGAFRFADTTATNGTLVVSNSRIEGQAGALGNVLESQTTGTGWDVYLNGTAYDLTNTVAGVTVATEDMGDGAKAFGGDLGVTGAFAANAGGALGGTWTGSPYFSGAPSFDEIELTRDQTGALLYQWNHPVDNYTFAIHRDPSANLPTLRWPYYADSQVDTPVEIGRTADDIDATTATAVRVSSLKIGATETISSTREGKFVGLNTTATQWRYFDAVSWANGDRVGSAGSDAWIPNAAPDAQYMVGAIDGQALYFAVPYEPGTVISRVSVRWQGEDANAGVVLTVQKRQGGTASAAWTTVGAAQTYTGDTETVSVYDVADETMAAGYAYRVQVEAVVDTNPARLWEIGIETSKRAY